MQDYLSTFRVPIDDIPEAKHWKVGGKYRVVAEVEQTGVNRERHYSDTPLALPRKGHVDKPRYRTMVEFKVKSVSAKHEALNKKANGDY